jgi:1-acyl-sn-glycerol-3-phosphate acyltransferase
LSSGDTFSTGGTRKWFPVRKALARLVLRLARWRTVGEVPRSGVLVGAPHTSNWDWVAMVLLMWSGGVPPRVLIKAEIMRTPLGPLLRANGGISLDRANPGAVVRKLIEEARIGRNGKPFLLILAAEGTRKKVDYWKSGFYRISQQTGLPISMGFIDGPTRTMGFGPSFLPSGDVVADMDMVRVFYADKHGIHPELRTEPRLREEDAEVDTAQPGSSGPVVAQDPPEAGSVRPEPTAG